MRSYDHTSMEVGYGARGLPRTVLTEEVRIHRVPINENRNLARIYPYCANNFTIGQKRIVEDSSENILRVFIGFTSSVGLD